MTLFGINGVRGTANRDLTPEVALQIGKVVGRTFGRRIAVATDARDSADMLRSAVSAGIMASGTDIVDLGILPTPVLQYYVKSHPDITGGIVITASHNPPEHNGFKFIKEDGVEVSREEEQSIESSCETDVPPAPWKEIGEVETGTGAIVDHVKAVIAHVDAEAIRRANLTVCVDCANGSTCESTPMLLRLLNVRTFTINADPQSESPGRSSEPTEENLGPLMMLTKQVGADLGAAHDGADLPHFQAQEQAAGHRQRQHRQELRRPGLPNLRFQKRPVRQGTPAQLRQKRHGDDLLCLFPHHQGGQGNALQPDPQLL